MLDVPKDIYTVLSRRESSVNLMFTINLVTVTILTILFIATYGIETRGELYFFSYRLAFLLVIILLQFIIITRFFVFILLAFNFGGSRISRKEPDKKFGKYTAGEILDIVDEQCKKQKVKSVKRVYIMTSSSSNAMTMDVILFEPIRYSVIILFSNMMEIMNKDELSAVIGHEVAHVSNYDSWYLTLVANPAAVMIFALLIWFESIPFGVRVPQYIIGALLVVFIFYIVIRPVINRANRYFEYFADFSSAKVNGLIPMVNALIKLGQRHDTLIAFQHEFQRRFRVDEIKKDRTKFYQKLNEELKGIIDPDRAVEMARKLVKEYGGSEKELKKEFGDFEFFKPKIIDWREYDTHIRDYSLDFIELNQLISDLKESPQARLFKYASTNRFVALFQTHPRFRERILFLWESLKTEFGPEIKEILLTPGLDGGKASRTKRFMCPICQTLFKVKESSEGEIKVKCPGCRIIGELPIRLSKARSK